MDEAYEFLALVSGIKSLMLPPEANAAYHMTNTPFFIRKISFWEKIFHTFDSLYPVPIEDRWLHLRQRIMAYIPVMLKLVYLERAVHETIFEIFTPTDGFLFKGPPAESITDGLVLAQMRFWSPRDDFTLVGISFGWKDNSQLGYVYRLQSFIERYINNIVALFDPTADKIYIIPQSNPPEADKTPTDTIPTAPFRYQADLSEELGGKILEPLSQIYLKLFKGESGSGATTLLV
ncbi:MAG: hypothetical protein WAM60_03620 [Candidatus Promineifilaceae bacterium]